MGTLCCTGGLNGTIGGGKELGGGGGGGLRANVLLRFLTLLRAVLKSMLESLSLVS